MDLLSIENQIFVCELIYEPKQLNICFWSQVLEDNVVVG